MRVRTSAASSFDFGVEGFEFCAGIVNLELPVDIFLFSVGSLGPCPGSAAEPGDRREPACRQTLGGKRTEFIFGSVEPTAQVYQVKTENQGCPLRRFTPTFLFAAPWLAWSGKADLPSATAGLPGIIVGNPARSIRLRWD